MSIDRLEALRAAVMLISELEIYGETDSAAARRARALIAKHGFTFDEHGLLDWNHFPKFGGTTPKDLTEVHSWDAMRLLVGACADDLEIISR